jgi:hypothetical protein
MKRILSSRPKSRPSAYVAICIAGLVILASSGPCHAQLTARALGMGLAYTALARGVHAADWNPANLGLPKNPGFNISIFSVGAGVGNNSFSIDDYNRFATDTLWDENEIDELLGHVPDNGLGVDVIADVKVLSFSVGRFALALGVKGGGSAFLDKTLLEIPLQGTEVGKTYHFDDMNATALGIGSVKLSYGSPVRVSFADTFAVGGSLHIDFLGGYGKVDHSKLALEIGSFGFNIDGRYAATSALSRSGWGIDLGAAAKVNKRWTVSVGLLNLIGSVRWEKEVKNAGGYVRGDSISVFDLVKEDDKEKNQLVQDSTWTLDGKPFSRKIPVELRIGGLYEEGPYCLTVDYVQGFQGQGWVTTKPRFAFGTEWRKVKWLPLRMGVVVGGQIGFGTSFGFGIRPGIFVLDVGLMNRGFILPNSSKGVFLAVEMGVGL